MQQQGVSQLVMSIAECELIILVPLVWCLKNNFK